MMNKIGWAIGVVLIIGVGAIFYFILNRPTGPQATIRSDELAALAIPPLPAFFGQPTAEGNAGEKYAQLIAQTQDFVKDHAKIKDYGVAITQLKECAKAYAEAYAQLVPKNAFDPQFQEKLLEPLLQQLESHQLQLLRQLQQKLQPLLEAANMKDMKLFGGPIKAEELYQVRRTPEIINTIQEFYKAAEKTAIKLDEKKEREQSLALFKALAIFGDRLTRDNLRYKEVDEGLIIQRLAIFNIVYTLKNDPAMADTVKTLEAYTDTLKEAQNNINPKAKNYLFVISPGSMVPDYIKIAKEDQTRAMRVEALMLLGVARHYVQDEDKLDRINQALADVAKDPDPVVKAAAEWATKISAGEANTLGSFD